MERSIERIWKEGFIDDNAVIIPTVVDLYNQKSQNLVDKFDRMFEINRKAIIASASLIFLLFPFIGLPFLGLILSAMLLGLVYIGNSGLRALSLLDKSKSSYEYLKAFSNWRKDIIEVYGKTYTYFYPGLFMVLAIRFRLSDDAQSIINAIIGNNPDTVVILNTPWYFLAAFAFISGLLCYYGRTLYRIDLDIVYGPSFRKLDELIAEMEELRK